jgi:hypothetical protein
VKRGEAWNPFHSSAIPLVWLLPRTWVGKGESCVVLDVQSSGEARFPQHGPKGSKSSGARYSPQSLDMGYRYAALIEGQKSLVRGFCATNPAPVATR